MKMHSSITSPNQTQPYSSTIPHERHYQIGHHQEQHNHAVIANLLLTVLALVPSIAHAIPSRNTIAMSETRALTITHHITFLSTEAIHALALAVPITQSIWIGFTWSICLVCDIPPSMSNAHRSGLHNSLFRIRTLHSLTGRAHKRTASLHLSIKSWS